MIKNLNTLYCLIIQNRQALKLVPKNYIHYYVYSKRCLYIYFRQKQQMKEMMRKFEQENVKYMKRPSLLQSRVQYEDIVNHCLYKNRKKTSKVQINLTKMPSQIKNQTKFQSKLEQNNEELNIQKVYSQKPHQQETQQKISSESKNSDHQQEKQHTNNPLFQKFKHIITDKKLMNRLLKSFQ